MAEITVLERRHHAFYAPAYRILVNGSDLLTSELVEITTVQVDSTLEGADRFSFTVNSSFDFSRREFVTRRGYDQLQNLFAFGAEVAIHMGYRDTSSLQLLHRGMITGVQTSFPAAGLPQITVSGYDLSYCMRHSRRSRVWDRQKDSQIVAQIAGSYNLTADVQDSQVEHARTEQNQQTDQEFLAMLAERNGYEVFTRDRTLYFKQPASDQAAVVTLEWGKGLVSFSPELNIAEQITEVEVRGWNVATKEEIVGRARAGDEHGRDGGQRSGGEHLRSACRQEQPLKIRFPVRSQQEADQKARSILKQRSEQFIKGNGESIGLPEILPNTNIELRGLGRLFSKTYFVEQATHTVSTSGYKTTFRVKETTI
jgi:phage protein D